MMTLKVLLLIPVVTIGCQQTLSKETYENTLGTTIKDTTTVQMAIETDTAIDERQIQEVKSSKEISMDTIPSVPVDSLTFHQYINQLKIMPLPYITSFDRDIYPSDTMKKGEVYITPSHKAHFQHKKLQILEFKDYYFNDLVNGYSNDSIVHLTANKPTMDFLLQGFILKKTKRYICLYLIVHGNKGKTAVLANFDHTGKYIDGLNILLGVIDGNPNWSVVSTFNISKSMNIKTILTNSAVLTDDGNGQRTSADVLIETSVWKITPQGQFYEDKKRHKLEDYTNKY